MSKYQEKKFEKTKKDVTKMEKEIDKSKIYNTFLSKPDEPVDINDTTANEKETKKKDSDVDLRKKEYRALRKKADKEETNKKKEDKEDSNKKKEDKDATKQEEFIVKSEEPSRKIVFDKAKVKSILEHFKNIELIKNKIVVKPNNENEVNTPFSKKDITDDSRYTYYLKKLKLFHNYLNKEALKKYVLDKSKALRDRCIKNEADGLGIKTYAVEEQSLNDVKLTVKNVERGTTKTYNFKKVQNIEYFEIESYERADFEYAVYKFGDNLDRISKYLDMPIKKAILLFYVFHFQFKITDTLCEIVSVREWCEEDKKTFADCYNKYGRKLENYFNCPFKDLKNELDLKIYFYYYNNKVINETWTSEERGIFQHLFLLFRKDWEMYIANGLKIINFEDFGIEDSMNAYVTNNKTRPAFATQRIFYKTLSKPVMDIKSYYNNYYKKLSEEELNSDYVKFTFRLDAALFEEIGRRYLHLDRKKRRNKI